MTRLGTRSFKTGQCGCSAASGGSPPAWGVLWPLARVGNVSSWVEWVTFAEAAR
ncbi:MYXO-CTERM sorting domain-containing protein [Streptomyces sp. MMG1533]|uniref:MYXO-CTERM sorting domain-containing protein n=1 Tax=Streptomyces sp. MMG1533 TaxID=1415546 RepID=UPI003B63382C